MKNSGTEKVELVIGQDSRVKEIIDQESIAVESQLEVNNRDQEVNCPYPLTMLDICISASWLRVASLRS